MGLEKPKKARTYSTGTVSPSDGQTVTIADLAEKELAFVTLEAQTTLTDYDIIYIVKVNDRVRCCYYVSGGVQVSNEVGVTIGEDGVITVPSGYHFHTGTTYGYRAY